MGDVTSIRDDLARQLHATDCGCLDYYEHEQDPDDQYFIMADGLLASPVVRRIQAEAWLDGEYAGRTLAGGHARRAVNPFGYAPGLEGDA